MRRIMSYLVFIILWAVVPPVLGFIIYYKLLKERALRKKAEQEIKDLLDEKKWMQEAHEQMHLSIENRKAMLVDERGKIRYQQ